MANFQKGLIEELSNPFCGRCKGLMVDEQVFGSVEVFWNKRCFHCGDMVDTLIILNRNLQGLAGSPKKWTCRVS